MKGGYWLLAIGFWLWPAVGSASGTDSIATDSAGIANGLSGQVSKPGPWSVGVWGAGARHSRFHTRLGIRYRDFYMAGVRVGRELPVSRKVAIDYFIDIVPLLISTNNPVRFRVVGTCYFPPGPCDVEEVMDTETARGFGVTPIGIQFRMFPRSRVQPTFGLSLGAAWYDKPVPDPDEQQLNFMGDLAAGAEVRLGPSSAVVMGLRQHHTSNAETGRVNPGIDSRVLYFGVTRSLGGRSRR